MTGKGTLGNILSVFKPTDTIKPVTEGSDVTDAMKKHAEAASGSPIMDTLGHVRGLIGHVLNTAKETVVKTVDTARSAAVAIPLEVIKVATGVKQSVYTVLGAGMMLGEKTMGPMLAETAKALKKAGGAGPMSAAT